jgi:hypothetical protein
MAYASLNLVGNKWSALDYSLPYSLYDQISQRPGHEFYYILVAAHINLCRQIDSTLVKKFLQQNS